MHMIRWWLAVLISPLAGCVIVNPGELQVSASPSPRVVSSPGHGEARTAYGPALERVLRQEQKVIDELQQRDWNDVLEETSEWTEQVRSLSGYASTTHDPARFRAHCDRLLAQIQGIRDAALRQDPVACHGAIHSCDPVLDRLSREFPSRQVPVASVPPPASASPAPAGGPRPSDPRSGRPPHASVP